MKFDFTSYNSIFTADFETSTEAWGVDKARVWLWDICDSKFNHYNGETIDEFMNFVIKRACNQIYGFRNLAYDGIYILSWLLENGYVVTTKKQEQMKVKSFYCVISDIGQHYAYSVKCPNGSFITFTDTLKYVNMSIERSAECYKLPVLKGKIDYDKVREIGHIPTLEELNYIHNDTEIDMWTIKLNMEVGAVKFTQAGNARYEFKKLFDSGTWDMLFPEIDNQLDSAMRKAYLGGYVMVNEKYKNKYIRNVMSFDINSMYPAQMLHRPMPYGYPECFCGKYVYNEKFPIYIQRFRCMFQLKPNGIPTVTNRKRLAIHDNAYMTSSGCEQIELTMASPDFELFLANYNVWCMEYIDGFMFQAMQGRELTPEEVSNMSKDECIEEDGKGSYFYEYIKKWRYKKEYEPIGSALRDYAKRMQNALYGAMATNPVKKSAVPYLDNGVIKYHTVDGGSGKGYYLPASIFITAWSRYFLITNIMKYRDIFIYCDTDSLYLKTLKQPADMPIHKSLYGFFKLEHKITLYKVIGCKRYVYWGREPKDKHDSFSVVCCGADTPIKQQINYTNFIAGRVISGKKGCKNVVGGKHIVITTYKLGKGAG